MAELVLHDEVIDISGWQLKWTGIATGAIIKSSEGNTWVDTFLVQHIANAVSKRVPFTLYHYWRARCNSIVQARHFAAQIKGIFAAYPIEHWYVDPRDGLIPVFVDVENWDGLQPETCDMQLRGMLAELARELEGLPFKIGVYTRKFFFDYLSRDTFYAQFMLWNAHYTYNPTRRPIYLPLAWTRAGKEEEVHQYTHRGDGSKYGVESRYIDVNTARFVPSDEPPLPTLEEIVRMLVREAVKAGWDLSP